ncbi:hypothetical protein COT72_02185 [archaeon CG10_big_fil_rev_8_21_14_0_10_43_11]|nr:MAG: hypothetical protein COT72_02185 [archaeon CG10_big_fil_rev_8_21_14_0_10_43_11]
MSYKYVDDLTSDVMFRVTAKKKEALFEDAALGMVNIMYDTKKVSRQKKYRIKTQGSDIEEQLYNFLTQVLITFETKQVMLKDFHVTIRGKNVNATAHGMKTNTNLIQTHVKGVTYYNYSVSQKKNAWVANVVVDI